jgi:hypothetical protein
VETDRVGRDVGLLEWCPLPAASLSCWWGRKGSSCCHEIALSCARILGRTRKSQFASSLYPSAVRVAGCAASEGHGGSPPTGARTSPNSIWS